MKDEGVREIAGEGIHDSHDPVTHGVGDAISCDDYNPVKSEGGGGAILDERPGV